MILHESLIPEVLAALAEPRGVVRLLGLPGAGASTLAREVAPRFRGPRFLIGGPEAVERLAALVGGPPLSRLTRLGPSLIVVDHEDALPAADLAEHLEAWRSRAPEIRVLLACRRTPNLVGERTIRLPPLGPEVAQAYLAAVCPGVDVPDEVVAALDGLPLAWAAASRRLAVSPGSALIEPLRHDPFAAVGDGEADAPGLVASWSRWWADTPSADRDALTSLAAFASFLPRPAAEAALGLGEEAALDTLQRLRLRGLLEIEAGRPIRFQVPTWVRRWVRHIDPGGYTAAQDRLLSWYVVPIRALGPEATRHRQADLLAWGVERDNLVGPFLEGSSDPRAVYLARVAADLAMLDPLPSSLLAVRELYRRALDIPGVDPADRQRLVFSLAHLAIRSGRFEEAREVLRDPAPGPPGTSLAPVRTMLGDALLLHGAMPEAAVVFGEAVAEALAAEDREAAAMAAQQLGVAHARLGQLGGALEATELAASLVDACMPVIRAKIWQNAAFVYTILQRLDEAEQNTRRALEVYTAARAPRHVGMSKLQLGALAARRGDRVGAARWLSGATDDLVAAGEPRLLPYARGEAAQLQILDAPAEAAEALQACADALETARFHDFVQQYRAFAALALALDGRPGAARALVRRVGAAEATGNGNAQGKAIAAWVGLALDLGYSPDGGARIAALDAALATIPDHGKHAVFDALFAAVRDHVIRGATATWVAADGGRLRGPGGDDAEVTGANAKILLRLLENARAGAPLGVPDLAAAGWPDERIEPEAAGVRVRVALTTLRKAGLRQALERVDGGWRLRPDHPVRVFGAGSDAADLPDRQAKT